MRPHARVLRVVCLVSVLFAAAATSVLFCQPLKAADKTAADFLPATTVVYAEVHSPAKLVDALKNHPLRKKLEQMEQYKQLTEENPDYLKARAGLGIFEFVVGRDWDVAIGDIAGDGLYVGVDAATEGAVAMAHAPNADALAEIRDRLIKAAKQDAERKGKDVPFEEREYREHKVYKADKAVFGIFGKWLVVTNKPDLGRKVADNLLDGGQQTLAKNERFIAARQQVGENPIAWGYADVKSLRDAGVAKELYKDKSDNPGVELLVGGILAALKEASTATAEVHLRDDRLTVALNVPHDRAASPEEKQFYFGEKGRGAATAPLTPKHRLLAVTSYRDVGEMWRRRSDLFDENVNANLAQADSNLSTVFAGLDFGSEVLGALHPEAQIILTEQDFKNRKTRVPKIKLPAGALVLKLKEPEKMRRQLKVSFQSLIGLTNLGAGQNDLPQLELKTEDVGDGQLVSASYEDLPEDAEVSNDIIYNFSPSLAFVGEHFIVASTRELALELMKLAADTKPLADDDRVVNTQITLSGQVLRNVLEANRESLIAQNMLEKGHTHKEAEKEIGVLFTLLELAGDASVELASSAQTLRLEMSLGFNVE